MKYYRVSDGFFTYYVNVETGARKLSLEPGDIEIEKRRESFAFGGYSNAVLYV